MILVVIVATKFKSCSHLRSPSLAVLVLQWLVEILMIPLLRRKRQVWYNILSRLFGLLLWPTIYLGWSFLLRRPKHHIPGAAKEFWLVWNLEQVYYWLLACCMSAIWCIWDMVHKHKGKDMDIEVYESTSWLWEMTCRMDYIVLPSSRQQWLSRFYPSLSWYLI